MPTDFGVTTPFSSTVAIEVSELSNVTGFLQVAFKVRVSSEKTSAVVLESETSAFKIFSLLVTVFVPAVAVIFTEPDFKQVITPLLSTVAIFSSELVHVTGDEVVLVSLYEQVYSL